MMNAKMARRLFCLGISYLAAAFFLGWLGYHYAWGGWGLADMAIAVERAQLAVMLSCTFVLVSGLSLIASFILPALGSTACRSCGYDLRGQLREVRCPECGKPYVNGKESRPT